MININYYYYIIYLSLVISGIIGIQEINAFDASDTNFLSNIFNITSNSEKKNNINIIDYPNSNLTNLTNNTKDSIYPDIAAFEKNVYVIYQEFVSANKTNIEKENNYDIFFIKSEDNGKTFNKPLDLSNTTEFSERPQIAVNENGIFVVWVDQTGSNNKEIFFTKSLDNGKTFDEKINLSNNSEISNYPEISVYDENVYVVWRDTANPNNKSSTIMFKNSVDKGKTFNNAIELTEDTYNSYPKINSYGDFVYVVWNNDGKGDKNSEHNLNNNSNRGMFFVQSFDKGFNFEPIVTLDTRHFGESQIAIDKNKVVIVWAGTYSNSLQNIYFVASSDNARTFTNTMTVFNQEPNIGSSNNITNGSNETYDIIKNPINVDIPHHNLSYLVWQNIFSKEHHDIIFMYSDPNNNKGVKIINLSNNNVISECPSLAISNNMIYFIWEDFLDKDIHDILFARLNI